jgi:hypothetical protein
MGVFGFLSKAHLDQAVPSGDIQAQVQIFDDKIQTQKDNIKTARAALTQMDSAVDQTMGRSQDEKGADKAVAIRRSQARERTALQNDISKAQTEITRLQEQRAPIASQARQVEAEVGPIKYIAALIYGDNPEANLLEKAVRWVIILIVIVFDPLALTLLLAATKTFEWERGSNTPTLGKKEEHPQEDSPSTTVNNKDTPVFDQEEILIEEAEIVAPKPTKKQQILTSLDGMWNRAKTLIKRDTEAEHEPIKELVVDNDNDDDDYVADSAEKEARRAWKEANPGETIKHHRRMFEAGIIDKLPWMHTDYYPSLGLVADNAPTGATGEIKGFGTVFPLNPIKGDMFLRVDQLPSALYKFNGVNWIEVDKELSDQHAYDDAYIDHLISKISTGEYDPELLSNAERTSIEQRLNNNSQGV